MFQKQKKRMGEYVLTTPANHHHAQTYQAENTPVDNIRVAQPREYNRHTSIGNKNMPALINNTMNSKNKIKIKGPVIRPLRSPPPEWKAKVDTGYKSSNAPQLVTKRWIEQNYERGYESAPLEDLDYEGAEFTTDYDDEAEGPYARSFHGFRAETSGEGPETAAFYFNAKYHNRPQFFAKPHLRRDAFVTTPYSVNDFNARAVGWSKAYAQHY